MCVCVCVRVRGLVCVRVRVRVPVRVWFRVTVSWVRLETYGASGLNSPWALLIG